MEYHRAEEAENNTEDVQDQTEEGEDCTESVKEEDGVDEWGMRTKYGKPLVVQAFIDSDRVSILSTSYSNPSCSKYWATRCMSYFDNIQEVKRVMCKEHLLGLFSNKSDCIVDDIEEIKCSDPFGSLNIHNNPEGIFSGLQFCCALNTFLRNNAMLKWEAIFSYRRNENTPENFDPRRIAQVLENMLNVFSEFDIDHNKFVRFDMEPYQERFIKALKSIFDNIDHNFHGLQILLRTWCLGRKSEACIERTMNNNIEMIRDVYCPLFLAACQVKEALLSNDPMKLDVNIPLDGWKTLFLFASDNVLDRYSLLNDQETPDEANDPDCLCAFERKLCQILDPEFCNSYFVVKVARFTYKLHYCVPDERTSDKIVELANSLNMIF
jgi:hypothetical protein